MSVTENTSVHGNRSIYGLDLTHATAKKVTVTFANALLNLAAHLWNGTKMEKDTFVRFKTNKDPEHSSLPTLDLLIPPLS